MTIDDARELLLRSEPGKATVLYRPMHADGPCESPETGVITRVPAPGYSSATGTRRARKRPTPPTWNHCHADTLVQAFAQVRPPENTLLYLSAGLSPRSVLYVVLSWIAAVVIVAVVAVACRFIEEGPTRPHLCVTTATTETITATTAMNAVQLRLPSICAARIALRAGSARRRAGRIRLQCKSLRLSSTRLLPRYPQARSLRYRS